MSHKVLDVPEITNDVSAWASLLKETDEEILASQELTGDEKRRLLESGAFPESEPEPGDCVGRPVSETIIEDRGDRRRSR